MNDYYYINILYSISCGPTSEGGGGEGGSKCLVEVFLINCNEQQSNEGDGETNIGHNHNPKTDTTLLLGVYELRKLRGEER